MYRLFHHYSVQLTFIAFLGIIFACGWALAVRAQTSDTAPIFRFYSENFRAHFYTVSVAERDDLIASDQNWCYEGVAYYAPHVESSTTTPLHRFYSPQFQSHFYTISEAEKDGLIANDPNWTYEGVAYNISTETDNSTPLHRFYSPQFQSHFYTISEAEKDGLIANDPNWTYEGVAYYVDSGPLQLPDMPCGREVQLEDLGPDISVGLDEYTRDDIREDGVTITATNAAFNIIDRDDDVVATLNANTPVEIRYDSDGNLLALWEDSSALLDKFVTLAAQNPHDATRIIFHTDRKDDANDSYDEFRGQMRMHYSKSVRRIWLINILPLEQYVWGIGEMTGTGPEEFNRLMTQAFRTYGYWKIVNSTRHIAQGFIVLATPDNQIYRGYKWEDRYPRIREAATDTHGKIAIHDDSVILLPFSSWTDGDTRYYGDGHWSSQCNTDPQENISSIFPYLVGVEDPWGKHPTRDTCDLAVGGNHMVGISANGALNLAGDEDWNADQIFEHYITGGTLTQQY